MLLLIDNYDSFTYNLVHYFGEIGADVVVKRNDALNVQEAMALNPSAIVLSPGPCDPDQAGICLALTQAAAETRTPLLGVCLGHLGRNWGEIRLGTVKLLQHHGCDAGDHALPHRKRGAWPAARAGHGLGHW